MAKKVNESDDELSGLASSRLDEPTKTEKSSIDSKGEGTKPYTVLTDKAIIDDGKGGTFKSCNEGDVVHLDPEHAAKLMAGGVCLEEKADA